MKVTLFGLFKQGTPRQSVARGKVSFRSLPEIVTSKTSELPQFGSRVGSITFLF